MDELNQYPFFPLGMVTLPRQDLRLHIFEPRYRELFEDLEAGSEDGERDFVQVPVIDSRLQGFATVVRLEEITKRYGSGELDVQCAGVRIVRVHSYEENLPGKLYAGGEVSYERMSFNANDIALPELLLDRCRQLLMALGVHRNLPSSNQIFISYALGPWLGLTIYEEYALLTMATEHERQEHLLDLVNKRIETTKATSELRHRAQLNGHFRYVGGE